MSRNLPALITASPIQPSSNRCQAEAGLALRQYCSVQHGEHEQACQAEEGAALLGGDGLSWDGEDTFFR